MPPHHPQTRYTAPANRHCRPYATPPRRPRVAFGHYVHSSRQLIMTHSRAHRRGGGFRASARRACVRPPSAVQSIAVFTSAISSRRVFACFSRVPCGTSACTLPPPRHPEEDVSRRGACSGTGRAVRGRPGRRPPFWIGGAMLDAVTCDRVDVERWLWSRSIEPVAIRAYVRSNWFQ